MAAADQLVLTRIILGRAARRHGLRISLSPVPLAGSVGSGAHQHFSLTKPDGPLFSGGSCAVSGLRMRPGNWAGAYACRGIENREAAVRFVRGGPGSAHGGNVEVKIVDPSANSYLASAAILGLALDGVRRNAPLPPETTVDPAKLSDSERRRAGIDSLARSQADMLAALDNSELLRSILGDVAVDMVVAVRRWEHEHYGDLDPEQLADKFRTAWSL